MEIQVIYVGVSEGDFYKKAALGMLFEGRPGASNRFFEKLDVLNLPDPVQ